MDSDYTSWSIEEFNTALARKYASDRPVMAPWRREAAEAANVAAGNMPVHDVFTGRSARAAKARQALCEGRQAMGWHPWTIAHYYGIAPEMVSEALGEDGAPEWLELQETLTRRRRRLWLTQGAAADRPWFPKEPISLTGHEKRWPGFPNISFKLPKEPGAYWMRADFKTGEVTLDGKPVVLDSSTLEPNKCQCRRCDPGLGPNGLPERFIVCQTCGNKRCPHAEWHGDECSGSNEVGQTGRLPSKTGELGAQTGGLSGDRQVDEMVAGLMKAGGGDGNDSDGGDAWPASGGNGAHGEGACGAEGGFRGRRRHSSEGSSEPEVCDPLHDSLEAVRQRRHEGTPGVHASIQGVLEAQEGGEGACVDREDPQVAALKAEIERLKAELAVERSGDSGRFGVDRMRDMIPPPTRDDVERWSRELESGMVIDRNAQNEGITVGGVRYEPPRKRPVVQDAPKPKKKGGAQRLREKRLAAEKAPCSATVAERAATKFVKAKKPKAPNVAIEFKDAEVDPKVLEGVGVHVYTEPKPEPKPPVRMVPLPRRPAGAARCDCGLAVQHTGSDGVGRCTRCATEAYRMRKGAAE